MTPLNGSDSPDAILEKGPLPDGPVRPEEPVHLNSAAMMSLIALSESLSSVKSDHIPLSDSVFTIEKECPAGTFNHSAVTVCRSAVTGARLI